MIFNVYTGGGGQTGATLHVESTGQGTVTVSSAAVGRSYSKDVAANSTVDFPGLASGVWTVTLSREGMQPATRSVSITSDYSVTISYFEATLNITYPADSTCSIQSATMNFTAPDKSGFWKFAAPLPGLWVIYCTHGELSTRREVNITASGQVIDVLVRYEVYGYEGQNPTDYFTIGDYIMTDHLADRPGYVGIHSTTLGTKATVTLTEPVNLAEYPVIKVTGFALDGDNRYPQKLQLRDAPFGNVLAETVILNTTDANWGSEAEPATATISAASGGYAYVVFENPRGIGGNLQWPFYISTIEYLKE